MSIESLLTDLKISLYKAEQNESNNRNIYFKNAV